MRAVEENLSGSRPRELFEDVLETVEEDYIKSRSILKDAKDLAVQADTTFDAFNASIEALAESDGELKLVPEVHR